MKNLEFLRFHLKIGALLGVLFALGCEKKEDTLFSLLSPDDSGVHFENSLTETDELNILDYLYFYNGGGTAIGDINNDGFPDLYFSSNQKTNKLYLNNGDLTFTDITETAGVGGKSSWNTGAVMADVNGDGLLDIFVLSVSGINGFTGHHELFINQGDNTFVEQSAQFGLDLNTFGTTASFFDYDLDGDLDVYILNHAVHTEESFGRAAIRNERNAQTGDRLMRNDEDRFTDVSEEAGIYGGINGYGLGLAVSDFDLNGYPDIYVGNDFHEDDYYYLNNGDGTFTESLRTYFGHSSRFSMGSDVADLNHDGWPDLISLDMAPEDETVLKSSEGDDTPQTLKMRTTQFGYHYQYARNMLFFNNGNKPFTETALMSGVAATDWSWSALFADFNLDGNQDLFVSNGIPRRPNDLDFIRYVSNEEIQKQLNSSKLVDQEAINKMPEGYVANYMYEGTGSFDFKNQTGQWIPLDKTVSGATAYGDLDNDGDLDIVTNNINAPAGIYINQQQSENRYLKVRLEGTNGNKFGVGARVTVFSRGKKYYKELFPSRGWQASSEPMLHFGLGATDIIDSLNVTWANQAYETIYQVPTNQTLTLKLASASFSNYFITEPKLQFRKSTDDIGISYRHKEDGFSDFNYQKLIPYGVSDRGPAVAYADLNGDGLKDLYLGGGKNQKPQLLSGGERGFQPLGINEIEADSIYEDVSALIAPSETGQNVLLIGSHSDGRSISGTDPTIRKYFTENGELVNEELIALVCNASVMRFNDQPDQKMLFIGSYDSPLNFGKVTESMVIMPDGGQIGLNNLGLVTDAIWEDFSGDGLTDLIVVGEWMAPTFLENKGDRFEKVLVTDESLNGLWQTIIPFDIDKDGDTDYLLGNWGLNSKFKSTPKAPMLMHYADFDENGLHETLISIEKNGDYYPLLGLNELAEQLVLLRKKFPNYSDFAGKTTAAILGPDLMGKAQTRAVHILASGFLRNNENTFTFEAFPNFMQVAPIKALVAHDFDGSGSESVLAAGNYFGVIPFHGRYDSFSSGLIRSDVEMVPGHEIGLDLSLKSARHLTVIETKNKPYLLVVYNDDEAEIYEFESP